MRRHSFRLGPFHFDVDFSRYRTVLTGAKAALRHGDRPIDPKEVPDGWERRREWPHGLTNPTSYWLNIWQRNSASGAHVTVRPYLNAWRVEYDPENSWHGGFAVASDVSFGEAIDAAIRAMEAVNQGATRPDLRRIHVD